MTDLWLGTLGLGPADWWGLFVHFTMLSLLAVGGAITTVPDMHRYVVVQKSWLSDAQLSASVALAQAAPGPNDSAHLLLDRFLRFAGLKKLEA